MYFELSRLPLLWAAGDSARVRSTGMQRTRPIIFCRRGQIANHWSAFVARCDTAERPHPPTHRGGRRRCGQWPACLPGRWWLVVKECVCRKCGCRRAPSTDLAPSAQSSRPPRSDLPRDPLSFSLEHPEHTGAWFCTQHSSKVNVKPASSHTHT